MNQQKPAVAVQTAMSNTDVDRSLASLVEHATTPGLGGLPNGIAAYLDINAADAVNRINEFIVSEKVLGVSIELDAVPNMEFSLIAASMELLATNQASVDVCGDINSIQAMLKMHECGPEMSVVCNISQCTRSGKPITVNEWSSVASAFSAHENVTIKITQPPSGEYLVAVDQLTHAIRRLADSIGSSRILFGSAAKLDDLSGDRNGWQYFDAATRWATANERDQLFRENTVRVYRL